jgi:hypothetical protein
MKIFEVELKRTSFVTIRIEAETADEAENLAWEELASDGSYGEGYASWDVELILETEKAEA